MPQSDADLRLHLLETDAHFAELHHEHHHLGDELARLQAGPYLSEEQQFREIELKKRKLRLKDQMSLIIDVYRRENSHATS
ncbi:MAG: DUF465 domain-containing protein [Candidatus Schekmanbacteria bacterium]|nr:DUF465 domain-containing protein [Candidatus Schekmanbacteria bacterium]